MRTIISVFISLAPFNRLRIFLYRVILGYNISYSSKIGICIILNCKKVKIEDAKIGFLNQIIVEEITMSPKSFIHKFNRIKNLNILKLEEGSHISSWNFIGAPKKNHPFRGKDFPQQNLIVGCKSSILRNNYFDVVREIIIGENVVFGGTGSEIWTHGFDVYRNMLVGSVTFGNNIFVGSKCIFTKGIKISDKTTIGPGSVIYKSISDPGIYSSHQLYKVK